MGYLWIYKAGFQWPLTESGVGDSGGPSAPWGCKDPIKGQRRELPAESRKMPPPEGTRTALEGWRQVPRSAEDWSFSRNRNKASFVFHFIPSGLQTYGSVPPAPSVRFPSSASRSFSHSQNWTKPGSCEFLIEADTAIKYRDNGANRYGKMWGSWEEAGTSWEPGNGTVRSVSTPATPAQPSHRGAPCCPQAQSSE